MPTGYTAGILDGKIKDFKQFAKQCIRAFGAAMHMRDDSFDKEYEPRKPNDYHLKEIKEAKKKIENYKKLSDERIIAIRKNELLNSKKHHLTRIDKIKKDATKFSDFLNQAQKYSPPTDDYLEIKKFMVDQLESTIKHDCNTTYHDIALIEIENQLDNVDPEVIRKDLIASGTESLEYHEKEYAKEVERCEESNKWVRVFIDSLNG